MEAPPDNVIRRKTPRLEFRADDRGRPPKRRESQLNCPDGIKDAKDAQVDVARANLEIAEMQFQLITSPVFPRIEYVIAPYVQAVVAAETKVQKLKTGGSRDQATLELNVAVARADVERFQAAPLLKVAEAAQGVAYTQRFPFAWTDPNPCGLGQLPGKLPTFTEIEVRAGSTP